MKKLVVIFICIFLLVSAKSQDQKINDLLSRMTVEEKVAQLRSTWSVYPHIDNDLLNNPKMMDSLFANGIGMINPDNGNGLEESISNRNRILDYIRTKTKLAIPPIFLDEAHHGLLAMQSDVFPTSIGLACSWDTLLTEKIYAYVAALASARGTNMVLAPVIDVTRDPRWGRTGETFGEDPYLCGLMGSAVVRGFQGRDDKGDGTIGPNHVAATLKHFTGHGQSEAGINMAPSDFPERVLRTFHMEPFRMAIGRVNPAAIMPAYLEIDGVPCHGNEWLLKEVARKEWGYHGVFVSDWFAIDQLYQKHLVAADRKAAALMAFNAGVTVDLPMGRNYALLKDLIDEGKISINDLDQAVSYVLRLKLKLGLLENKNQIISLEKAKTKINQPEGRALALKAAEESMVLLKNDNNMLPLKKDAFKTIAVIGPFAEKNYTGDYSGYPVKSVSILEGIKNEFGKKVNVVYAKGVDLTASSDSLIGRVILPNPEDNYKKIENAVNIARLADIIIVAVGEPEVFSMEAGAPDHFGDMSDLNLQSQQDSLVKALVATGKPVIVYLAHARPLSINWISKNVPAIIDGWFTGEESGNAFAHILFGDVCPSGKLTISVPRSVGQIPIYYNHKPSAHFFEYVTEQNTPLYPFGYGLSYNIYSYSSLKLNGDIVSVDVANTGKMKGDEIVQCYIHQKVSSATRPVKELKDFARITLNPGETKTVSFAVDDSKLAFWTKDMKYAVEPGVFEILVGRSSDNLQKIDLIITKTIKQ
jgi:beta-glucosidase